MGRWACERVRHRTYPHGTPGSCSECARIGHDGPCPVDDGEHRDDHVGFRHGVGHIGAHDGTTPEEVTVGLRVPRLRGDVVAPVEQASGHGTSHGPGTYDRHGRSRASLFDFFQSKLFHLWAARYEIADGDGARHPVTKFVPAFVTALN